MRAEQEAAVGQELITGGGEMGALIRSHGWAQTGLGAIATWSHSLITALSILLNAGSPMFLLWGRARILFYNDAYSSIAQQRNHPVLLGQPVSDCWAEDWDSIRLDVEQVFTTGQPLQRENEPFPINRDGNEGWHYYTWSYSAIRDETGQVGGVFATGCRVIPEETTNTLTSEQEYQPNYDRNQQTMRSLLRLSEKLNSTLDLETLLDSLVQEAINQVNAESGCSGLYTPKGMVCHKYFHRGKPLPLEYCWHPGHGLPGWLIVHKVPYLTNDALTDTQIVHELCVQFGVWSALSTPILNPQGKILGFFEIHNKKDGSGFTLSDQETLVMLSQVAAIATQNALSYQNLQRTENTLRQSEERYQAFIEQSSEAIWRFELEQPLPVNRSEDEQIQHMYEYGYLAECNQMMAQMYGFASAQDILGVRLDAFLVADDPRNTDYLRAFIRSGYRLLDAESYEVDQWGHPKIFLNNLIGVIEDGFLVRAWGTQRDISDRKRTEAALQESTAILNTINQTSPTLIFVKDLQGRMLMANPATLQAIGKPEAEIIGKTDAEFHLNRDEAERIMENDRLIVETGQLQVFEEIVESAQGRRIYLSTKSPYRDAQGNIIGLIGVAFDISARKQAEASLRQSEERLRLAMEGAQMGTWDIDLVTGTAVWSEHHFTMLGYESVPTGEATEQMWISRIHPDDKERVGQEWQQSRQDGRLYRAEYRVIRADNGQVSWLAGLGNFTYDETGQAIRSIGVLFDISDRKLVEEALRQSEQRFRMVANTVPSMVWMSAPDGTIVWSSDAWYTYTGITPQRNARDWPQVLHPDDVERCLTLWSKALEEGTEYEIEVRNRRHDGEYRWFLTQAVPIRDEAGHITAWFGSTTDIHEKKLNEEALRQSEERFRLSARAVNGMVYDWDVLAGTVYRSEGLYHLIGIHPENVPTRKDWWGEHIHPDDLARIESVMAPIFQGSGDRYEFEYRVRHKDGHWVDVWDRGYLIRDQKEQVIRVVGFTADITKRKQIEEALRQSEERLRLALLVGKAGIWDWDIPNNRVTWSEQIYEFHGLAPDTFGGRVEDFAQLIHPDDQVRMSEAIRQALEGKASYEIEFRAVQPSGAVRWLSTTGGVIFNAQGHPIRMLGATRDITERKAVEQEREQLLLSEQRARAEAESANRIKDEFLAVLSHELRSPLNPILGWAKLLQVRKLDEQATQRALETIERNAKIQTQLIEDLLDVSRILRGKMVLNVSPVNLVTVIQAAIETVRLAAQAKHIAISVEVEQGHGDMETHTDRQLSPPLSSSPSLPFQIFGDAARLQQIVWNLLANAIKFTSAGGRVDVSLSWVNRPSSWEGSDALKTNDPGQTTKYAQIQVKDTGKGIKPDFLPHVFEYFRQEDGTTTRQFGGLGLGLAIVRHLTELHGGTVGVDSPGEGLGATFTVRIPLLTIASERPKNTNFNTNAINLSQVRILVVDDEADMRVLVKYLLEQYGAEVKAVASGLEALTAFDQFHPDVLLSDIGMPTMDGYMLMRQVRSRSPELGGQIPAIALTAYAGEFDQRQALAVGFQQHLAKPVEPEELLKAIATLIRR